MDKEKFDGKFVTIALADRRSLDIASRRERRSLSHINIDTERRATAIDDLTQALRLRFHDTGKLRAAWRRWTGRVSCNVI